MNALDIQRSYPGLFTFLNDKPDQQVPFFAFIVIIDHRLDQGIQEAVRQVKVEYRYAIGFQQTTAETPFGSKAGAKDLQAVAQKLGVEVAISLNFNAHQFVTIAALHAVGDELLGSFVIALGNVFSRRGVVDFSIKIS